MRLLATPLAVLSLIAATLTATSQPATGSPPGSDRDPGGGHDARRAPGLRVTTVARGLDLPWDVRPIGGGRYLTTQRDRADLTLIRRNGSTRNLRFPSGKVWTSGEVGLMGLAVDPRFSKNRRIYTCSGWRTGGGHDIRVIAWRINRSVTRAKQVRTIVAGMPATASFHGGCRLLIARNGALLVGTGDSAMSSAPQNRDSLGGKTLRVNRFTGRPWPSNPWAGAEGKRRFVLTRGHRNVQGLAQRADGTLWSVEHGTDRDDEVNLLRRGGNYGWDPDAGYDQSVPMTDFSLPGRQLAARWRSGFPTIATSGAAFVAGPGWGRYAGALAVGCLAGQRLMFVKFDRAGKLRWTKAPARLRDFGRLRGVTSHRGSLLVTTSNGGGNDRILRVRPR